MDKKLTIGFVGDFCLSQAHKKSTNYLSDAFDLSRKLCKRCPRHGATRNICRKFIFCRF